MIPNFEQLKFVDIEECNFAKFAFFSFSDGNRGPSAQARTGAHPGRSEGRHEEMPGADEAAGSTYRRLRVREDSARSATLEDTAGTVVPGGASQAGAKVDQTDALREGPCHQAPAAGDRDAQAVYQELRQE